MREMEFPNAFCSQMCAECDRGDDHLCTNAGECQCTHLKSVPHAFAIKSARMPSTRYSRRVNNKQNIAQYRLEFNPIDICVSEHTDQAYTEVQWKRRPLSITVTLNVWDTEIGKIRVLL
jgi:hypothetical protein